MLVVVVVTLRRGLLLSSFTLVVHEGCLSVAGNSQQGSKYGYITRRELQWNLSETTTSIIRFNTCD